MTGYNLEDNLLEVVSSYVSKEERDKRKVEDKK